MVLDFQYDELLTPDAEIVNMRADGALYGYDISIRYPSYRGTFLSCIESLEVEVDGENILPADLRFQLNGKEFIVEQLGELFKEHWYVLDTAHLLILNNDGLSKGKHKVKVKMIHRIPYTGYFGQYLVLDSVCEKTLMCK